MIDQEKIESFKSGVDQELSIFGVKTTPKKLFLRIVVYFFTITWVSFYPVYLLALHMLEEGFFSYDIFTSGIFGINAFFIFILVMIFMSGTILWGFIVILMMKLKQTKWIFITILWVLVSILIHMIFVLTAMRNGVWITGFWISGAGFVFVSVVSTYLNDTVSKAINNWQGPIIFIFFTALLPLFSMDAVSDSVKVALKKFGVGGNIIASVRQTSDKEILVSGELLLVTPGYIFIREEDSGYQSISRSNQTYLDVE